MLTASVILLAMSVFGFVYMLCREVSTLTMWHYSASDAEIPGWGWQIRKNNCCIFLKTEIQGWAALLSNFSVIDFKLIILKIIPARPGPHLSRRKAMIQPIFNRLPLAHTPIFGG